MAGTENYAADGKKLSSWATDNLILDATGHMSMFLIGKDSSCDKELPRTQLRRSSLGDVGEDRQMVRAGRGSDAAARKHQISRY